MFIKKSFALIIALCLSLCVFVPSNALAASQLKVTSVSVKFDSIKIKYSKQSKANYYSIYRKIGSKSYKKIKSKNKKTTFTDYKVCGENKVKYKVVAYSKKGKKLKSATSKTVTFKKVTNSAVEKGVVSYINSYRKSNGLASLKVSQDLTKTAKVRGKEIVTKFSHTRPSGTIIGLIKQYQNRQYCYWGENIEQITSYQGDDLSYEVFLNWKNSPPHNENMLTESYGYMGISVVESNGNYFSVLILGGE